MKKNKEYETNLLLIETIPPEKPRRGKERRVLERETPAAVIPTGGRKRGRRRERKGYPLVALIVRNIREINSGPLYLGLAFLVGFF